MLALHPLLQHPEEAGLPGALKHPGSQRKVESQEIRHN